MEDLKRFYGRPGFILYALLVTSCLALMYGCVRIAKPIKIQLNETVFLYDQARGNKDRQKCRQLDEVIHTLELKYKKWEKIHPFCYCAMSGTFGAQSILFGKCVAEMLSRTFRGDNQMGYFLTWVFLAGMLAFIFTQLHFLAVALSFFDALYVVPVFQCFFIAISTLGGAAYFAEFASFTMTKWIMFPGGLFLTLLGVYLLSARKMTKEIDRTEFSRHSGTPLSIVAGVTSRSNDDQALDLGDIMLPSLSVRPEESSLIPGSRKSSRMTINNSFQNHSTSHPTPLAVVVISDSEVEHSSVSLEREQPGSSKSTRNAAQSSPMLKSSNRSKRRNRNIPKKKKRQRKAGAILDPTSSDEDSTNEKGDDSELLFPQGSEEDEGQRCSGDRRNGSKTTPNRSQESSYKSVHARRYSVSHTQSVCPSITRDVSADEHETMMVVSMAFKSPRGSIFSLGGT